MTPITQGTTRTPNLVVAQIAQEELARLSQPNATLSKFDIDSSTDSQTIKFSDLPTEKQQEIIKGLQACEKGGFVTLDDYRKRRFSKTTSDSR